MGSVARPMRTGLRHRLASRLLCVALFLTGAAVLSATREAVAIENAPDWAYAMAHDLMSPYCPGRTLAECPSPQATSLRFEILMQASQGMSEKEIREMLAARYGDVLLAAPRAEGWGLSAYAIPIGFFVLGGPVVILIIRRLTAKGDERAPEAATTQAEASSAGPTAVDPELERQLEKELAEF